MIPILLAALAVVPPRFELPDTARPLRYSLELTIIPNQPMIRGTARIEVEWKEPLDTLWLNGKGITVESATLGGAPLKTVAVGGEFLGFTPNETIAPGKGLLEIRYRAALGEKDPVGAFRKQSEGEWYVFTTFTPIDARRAFPCFDEPRFKTPWDLKLRVPPELVALANARTVSESIEPDGLKTVTFAPTAPLPSELVAFAVGPFELVDAGVAGRNQVPVRIVTPKGRAADTSLARSVTQETLQKLEAYTGIAYPFDKLDHLALLEGAFGATENPGLITYRQDILLAKPEEVTGERRRAALRIMTHEMAHQWFGNLVTQAGWRDVWLSEGLATWMTLKLTGSDVAAVAAREGIMRVDGGPRSRPVRLAMSSREQMKGVYGGIVYQKGAAIAAMLEGWLGEDAVRRAIRSYLAAHRESNAKTEDLASAFASETGVDVAPVLRAFLDQTGVPVVSARLQCDASGARVKLSQSEPPRDIPVCVRSAVSGSRCMVTTRVKEEIPLGATCPAWVLPNAGARGYYRSELPRDQLAALVNQGWEELTAAERLTVALDVSALALSGRIPAADALGILPVLARDAEPRVVLAVFNFAHALAPAVRANLLPAYNRFLRSTFDTPRADIELLRKAQEKSLTEFLKPYP